MNKSYSELIRFKSFIERYEYLRIGGKIGEKTFGYERFLNQQLYHTGRWLSFRDKIIVRDNGCDLAIDGFDIYDSVLVHHINPITIDDVLNLRSCVFDPENVVSTQLSTHNAIHYGDRSLLILTPNERTKNDTCLWKH